jgi:RND family efflux transporter MFP subunit
MKEDNGSGTGNHMNKDAEPRRPFSLRRCLMVLITWLILPLAILTTGGWVALHLVETGPKSRRQPPPRQARLVEVVQVKRQDVPITIKAMGTVIPARQVTLRPQVAGKIVQISPELIPGGLFRTGQGILQIERDDYRLLVKQGESDVANTQRDLKIEYGNQSIAKQEYKLLGEVIDGDDQELVLRKPHLAAARASVEAARARLEQARLDLKRTHIVVPFNAVVKEKHIDLGSMVSPSSSLVTLTGTDAYWVEVILPVRDLRWIRIPHRDGHKGSAVRIYNPSGWGEEVYRHGRVIRLSGELEPNGRMAKLLVSIKDPLALAGDQKDVPPLLIGSYVRAEIEGQTVPSVVPLSREWLRDGDRVWIYKADHTMGIRPVTVLFREAGRVLISRGIDTGDRIVSTDLAAAVDGMLLRLPKE